jgi:hypothetical protein
MRKKKKPEQEDQGGQEFISFSLVKQGDQGDRGGIVFSSHFLLLKQAGRGGLLFIFNVSLSSS